MGGERTRRIQPHQAGACAALNGYGAARHETDRHDLGASARY